MKAYTAMIEVLLCIHTNELGVGSKADIFAGTTDTFVTRRISLTIVSARPTVFDIRLQVHANPVA